MTGHRLVIRVDQQRRDRQTKGTRKPFLYETCHSPSTCNLESKQNKLVFMIKKIWGVTRIKQERLQHVPDWCIAPMFAEDITWIEVSRKIVGQYNLGHNCFSNMVKWQSIWHNTKPHWLTMMIRQLLSLLQLFSVTNMNLTSPKKQRHIKKVALASVTFGLWKAIPLSLLSLHLCCTTRERSKGTAPPLLWLILLGLSLLMISLMMSFIISFGCKERCFR